MNSKIKVKFRMDGNAELLLSRHTFEPSTMILNSVENRNCIQKLMFFKV